MNAIEYFKKNGLLKSKMHLDIMNAESWNNEFYGDLKQIVEAFELVEKHGGLDKAKFKVRLNNAAMLETSKEFKQAIELVEKCNASD